MNICSFLFQHSWTFMMMPVHILDYDAICKHGLDISSQTDLQAILHPDCLQQLEKWDWVIDCMWPAWFKWGRNLLYHHFWVLRRWNDELLNFWWCNGRVGWLLCTCSLEILSSLVDIYQMITMSFIWLYPFWNMWNSMESYALYFCFLLLSNKEALFFILTCSFLAAKKSRSKAENGEVMDEDCIWSQSPATRHSAASIKAHCK